MPPSHALVRSVSPHCQIYHIQYTLLINADNLLWLHLNTVGSQFFSHFQVFIWLTLIIASPSGRAVCSVGLQPLACWNCGFESRWGHVCLPVVSVVCCQVEVSAMSRSLVQRSPTDCGVSLWSWKPQEWGGHSPWLGFKCHRKKTLITALTSCAN